MHARVHERFIRMRACTIRKDAHAHRNVHNSEGNGLDGSLCTAWCGSIAGCVHDLVGLDMTYGLVGTQVRIMHGLDDWIMWPNYTDGRMQLKVKAM